MNEADLEIVLTQLNRRVSDLEQGISRSGISSVGHPQIHGITSHIPRNNWSATTAPVITDDSGAGYGIGSIWIDTTNDKVYTCTDATLGAAVWKETSGGASMKMPEVIGINSIFMLGMQLAAFHSNLSSNLPTSTVWPTANLAYYIPLQVTEAITVLTLWCFNGVTVSGNVDMGIYNPDGTKVVSKGSTAQAGTSAIQVLDIADTPLSAGRYYLALALDNITGTFLISTSGPSVAGAGKAVGMYQQTSAFALPSPATFATYANTGGLYVPYCGLSLRTTI